jgi:membrane protease YdiL (CAAX protease family)
VTAVFERLTCLMTDPTEFVLKISFASALGIFILAAILRNMWMRASPLRPISDDTNLLNSPPDHLETLNPKLSGRVPTWFYQPLDLIGIGMIYLVFFALVISSVRAPHKLGLSTSPNALITSIGFQFFIAGLVVIIILSRRIKLTEWLGIRWRSWPWVFLIAPGAVLLMWFFFGLLQALGYTDWMDSLGVESVQDTVKLLQTSNNPQILGLMTFAAVIAAPICEEIVFRGYFYPAAKKFTGPWPAGIFTALVFASAHGSLSALLPLFIFGGLLVFVYEKTGSIWAPIAVHFCFNGATVLVQFIARLNHISIDSF